jgi:hypothetical protein
VSESKALFSSLFVFYPPQWVQSAAKGDQKMKMENGLGETQDLDLIAACMSRGIQPLSTPHVEDPYGKIIMIGVFKDTPKLRTTYRQFQANELLVPAKAYVGIWRNLKRDAVRGPSYNNGTLARR